MINPKKELFKWGPIDGRPIYVDPFVHAFIEYPKHFDGKWPDVAGFLKHDKVIFIIDYENLRNNGEHIFKKYVLDEKELKKGYELWIKTTEKVMEFEELVNKGLSKLSDAELAKQLDGWNKAHINFWVYGFMPELSNWGGEQLLKRKILEFNKLNFIEIFEKLSAPEDFSFFQIEEMELMKIRLVKNKEKQEEEIKKHQKRYYWLRNNYCSTTVLGVDYFRQELKKISEHGAKSKTKEVKNYIKKVIEEKQKVIDKYDISEEVAHIAKKLSYCVWWQDYRKSFIFIANHIITSFLKEISKRKGIQFKELCYYTTPEIEALVQKNKRIEAKKRFKGFIEYCHESGKITFLEGKEANDFIKPYIEVKVDPNIKEIKGIVVSKGKVKGKVKILFTSGDAHKMNKGDILVSPMTSPDFIIAMKKASAIITDEGGMTCHAAIVSRELGVPCIVGTRIATKVLKDGEEVEVDAEKGIVRRL